ncbi:MAG: hypothetical protein ABSE15_02880 [Candidatus Bathyarchaeia archaeon]
MSTKLDRKLDMTPLKVYAHKLPKNSPLRHLLLQEENQISVNAFLERSKIWIQLSEWSEK